MDGSGKTGKTAETGKTENECRISVPPFFSTSSDMKSKVQRGGKAETFDGKSD